jgi:hypothetical protein
LKGDAVSIYLPPQAAQAEGLPEGADAPLNQSREAHLAARPLHSPERGLTSGERAGRAVRRPDRRR